MYKESKKEKMIRFLIIMSIALITMYFFSIQFNGIQESSKLKEMESIKQMAVVLTEKTADQKTPVLIMVKEHENIPILVKYRINIEENFRFETLGAVELKHAPSAIEKDKKTNGVWVKMENSWTYYNESLELERDREKRNENLDVDFTADIEKTDTGQYLVKISDISGLLIQKAFDEEPYSVLRLSAKNDLWLVLFQDNTVLLTP